MPEYLTWDSSSFNGNLSPQDDNLQEVFDKLDNISGGLGGGGDLSSSDINTLSKYNRICSQ